VLSELASLEDIKTLLDRQYSLSIVGGHLVVNDVWYVDADGSLQKAKLAAPLNQPTPTTIGAPVNHQMFWSGTDPYFADGTPIPKLGNGSVSIEIGDTTYRRHLSNKPPEGFPSYTLLVEHYVALIASPAELKFGASPLTGATYGVCENTSPFKIRDTFSARAEITDLNQLLANDRIAVIGLGGTGAFLVDFLTKSPVASIHAYDFDTFKVHNAFRSPGEVRFGDFGIPKAEVYRRKYETFRHRIEFHRKQISADDKMLFGDTTFAFVCIDDGEARDEICKMLIELAIPFIDTGIGVEKEDGKLDGLIRTTLFTPDTAAKALERVPRDRRNAEIYRVFVQIEELNALNAAIAIIRYKQHRGFYADDEHWIETLLALGSSSVMGLK
jgi:molybdopterin/thiamine biosynthesis adenylyltransferase